MDLSKLSDDQLMLANKIAERAQSKGLNPDFVLPMVMGESKFNANAESPKGAYGLMQLMPATAKGLKKDPRDIDQNIDGGLDLINQLIANPKIGTNPHKVIAAYNGKPTGTFINTGKVEDLPYETLNHLNNILDYAGGSLPSPIYIKQEEEGVPKSAVTTTAVNTTSNEQPKYGFDVPGDILSGVGGAVAGIGSRAPSVVGKIYNKVTGSNVTAPATSASSGASWLKNWGNIDRPGFEGGVPEAAGKYNLMKPQGKTSGVGFKRFGPLEPGMSRVESLLEKSRLAEEASSPLGKTKALFGSIMSNPAVSRTLGGASVLANINEYQHRERMGDVPGQVLSGLGALGSAGAMLPLPRPLQYVSAGVGAVAPLTLSGLDYLRNNPSPKSSTGEDINPIIP